MWIFLHLFLHLQQKHTLSHIMGVRGLDNFNFSALKNINITHIRGGDQGACPKVNNFDNFKLPIDQFKTFHLSKCK